MYAWFLASHKLCSTDMYISTRQIILTFPRNTHSYENNRLRRLCELWRFVITKWINLETVCINRICSLSWRAVEVSYPASHPTPWSMLSNDCAQDCSRLHITLEDISAAASGNAAAVYIIGVVAMKRVRNGIQMTIVFIWKRSIVPPTCWTIDNQV